MAIKELVKPAKHKVSENEVKKFISQGGSVTDMTENSEDHRLTLRIPKHLMDKVDAKRKERIGTVSRNLMILEILAKALK